MTGNDKYDDTITRNYRVHYVREHMQIARIPERYKICPGVITPGVPDPVGVGVPRCIGFESLGSIDVAQQIEQRPPSLERILPRD